MAFAPREMVPGIDFVYGALSPSETPLVVGLVVSHNLSKDADQFKVQRRIIFFNGITDTYLMTIEGKCSIQPDVDENQLEVTCKIEEDTYKKHYLGLSDNVSYFVEQTDAIKSDPYHYKVIFKPQTIIPDIDLKTSN